MEKLWDKFISGEYCDHSGYFFENESRESDIATVMDSLLGDKYYVRNRYQKYYVIAFAIDYTRFHIWSKDYDAELIEWSQKGEIVDNYDPDHAVNPVVKIMNQLNMERES